MINLKRERERETETELVVHIVNNYFITLNKYNTHKGGGTIGLTAKSTKATTLKQSLVSYFGHS